MEEYQNIPWTTWPARTARRSGNSAIKLSQKRTCVMNINKKQESGNYNEYVKETMPKSHTFSSCIKAFLVGGLICVLGQGISDIGENLLHLDEKGVPAFTCIVLIFLGALLTGFGVYDVIGKFAGAGSIVPITGFANPWFLQRWSLKREGFVLGVGQSSSPSQDQFWFTASAPPCW